VARKSIINREEKRAQLVAKYQDRRVDLKAKIKAAKTLEEMMQLQEQLSKLPLNSSPVRHTTRCQQCGRAHAVYKKFGLCRICLRQQLMTGNVTGGRKSSW
jgi:small subunit ribosomal protein S14